MADRLRDKVAVITGGGSGIGRETALRFLEEGASVVAGDLREDRGEELLALAAERGAGERLRFLRADVTSEEDVEALVGHAKAEFGRLDTIFNNAGIPGAIGKLTVLKAEDWDFTFAVLVRSVLFGIKHAARVMIEQDEGGSIVNTGSIASFHGGCGPHAYSACKAAVVNLTRSAAVELARNRIRVNAVCPGGVNTPLVNRGNEEVMEQVLAKTQPLRIAGSPAHIAAAVVFLASDDAAFVTGESLLVDGGLGAAGPHSYHGEFEQAQPEGGIDHGSTKL